MPAAAETSAEDPPLARGDAARARRCKAAAAARRAAANRSSSSSHSSRSSRSGAAGGGGEEEDGGGGPFPELAQLRRKLWGHCRGWRPGQCWGVAVAMNKQRGLLVAPTGTGKSLCYQVRVFP
jgi:superfamily II DNA helicase RecQ